MSPLILCYTLLAVINHIRKIQQSVLFEFRKAFMEIRFHWGMRCELLKIRNEQRNRFKGS